MLWAGDCVHDGVPDVTRLNNYKVYLCRGFPQGLDANIRALEDGKILCIIDIYNEEQMSAFRHMFQGRFRHINSDYHGNTPTLPLRDYMDLLEVNGSARNVIGINGMILPYEDFYRVLETFAPVLTRNFQDRRRWSKEIIELSERDGISPIMVSTDPELNHPYYAYAKNAQENFIIERKKRNPAWPDVKPTLEEHWNSLDLTILYMPSYIHIPSGQELMLEVEPHLPTFSTYLSQRMQKLPQAHILSVESLEHKCANLTVMETVREKLRIIEILSRPIPHGFTGHVTYFADDRKAGNILDLTLLKV
jgi:hypothetical protein